MVAKTPNANTLLDNQADIMAAASAAGESIVKRIGEYADSKRDTANAAAEQAETEGNSELAARYRHEAKDWDEGGTSRVALHTGGGALIAGLGGDSALAGAAGAGAAATLAGDLNQLADSTKGDSDSNSGLMAGNIAANVLAGWGGALVGGNSGAFTAANADLYNRSAGNGSGQGSTANSALGWIGEQFASGARGAVNMANQFAALVNANGPQGPQVNPDELNGPWGNSKPPAIGGSAIPVAVCAPPVCAVVPIATQGTPTYLPGHATIVNAQGDSVKATGGGQFDASVPMGSKSNQFNQPKNPSYQPVRNEAANVDGTDFSGHALDRMQDRGLTPSVIQNAIDNGVATPSRGGTAIHYDSVNNVSVVTNSVGRVVTVKYISLYTS
ncbi:DUF4258 domain-containing protein [Pararobbsia alpina]|nr:DUF4258 domain-containing protein [Pararobbsia alpina]